MSSVHLSIIIPAYNEESRLPATLERISAYLEQQDYDAEILVVDDGSSDGTAAAAEGFGGRASIRTFRLTPNQGKGNAVRHGMLEARGAWRLFSDADLSTPIEEIEKFWPHVEAGADIVIGSRAIEGSDLEVRQSWFREILGRMFNIFIRFMGLSGIRDTQCGFKVFSAESAEKIFKDLQLTGWVFDVEALLRARRIGYRIVEAPVRWINSPNSRVRVGTDALKIAWEIIWLRCKL